MDRLKVGVVFGGRSVEHDVSVVTAHQVMAALAAGHDVVPIYITKEGEWLTAPGLNDLAVYKDKRWMEVGANAFISPEAGAGGLTVLGGRLKGGKHIPLDVVIPAVHGTFGEDGTLQGLLELADIPYAGSGVVGSAVGMDKPTMKAVFGSVGLPVLPHVVIEAHRLDSELEAVVAEIQAAVGYPAFVKPSRLGSSVGIGKGRDRQGLIEALEVARRYDRRIMVEPALEGCIEINCSVLGGHGFEARASVCEQPVTLEEFLSFSDKYLRGAKTTTGSKQEQGAGGLGRTQEQAGMADQERRIPAPISDELTATVQRNAVAAFKAVDAAGVARVDAFVKPGTGETWVMEINTVPGSFSFYLWEESGISFEGLMQSLIDIALAGYRAKSELLFSFDSGMLETRQGAKTGG
jgi:D-alanine-D-alanine ligase